MKKAIALGLFDGVHAGHRAVLRETVAAAREKGLLPAVFTFAEPMAGKSGAYLYPVAQREGIFLSLGIRVIYRVPFASVREMDGETFAERLVTRYGAGAVLCGENFRFGKGAAWTPEEMKRFGARLGFEVRIPERIFLEGEAVSSTNIRERLRKGDVEGANARLGAPYEIGSPVVHGARLGRGIGFPTINQGFGTGQLLPKKGVYRSETLLPDGRHFPSVTNIGIKPTVHYRGAPLAETYIDGFAGNLYGETPRVRLLGYLREERTFPTVAQLSLQMEEDVRAAREGLTPET